MTLFFDIAAIVLPTFIVMFLGYVLRRLDLIDNHFIGQVNRLVFIVFLPLLLFHKISQSNFFTSFNVALLFGCIAATILTFLASFAFASWRGYPASIRGVFCQGSFRGNLAIIGLAVVLSAYGDEGLTRASVLMGFIVPLLNIFAVIALLLPHYHNNVLGISFWLQQFFLNPLIIASFLGIAWSILGVPTPILFDNTLSIVTSMTLPLALIAIGAGFTLDRLRGDLHLAGLATGVKIVFMPVLTGFLLWILGVHGLDFSIGVLMIGSPTAAVSFIMASQMKGDTKLASSIIVLSTLFSILTYTAILLVTHLWFQ